MTSVLGKARFGEKIHPLVEESIKTFGEVTVMLL
jgi:hypothetical protein